MFYVKPSEFVSIPKMVRLIVVTMSPRFTALQASFNSKDGAIDRTVFIKYERILYHVSIPKMVRLIDLSPLSLQDVYGVSIPKMVRLIDSETSVNQVIKQRFNSKDGAIDRQQNHGFVAHRSKVSIPKMVRLIEGIALSVPISARKFQFQRWCD